MDYQPRIDEARQGLGEDPAIQARAAEVEAAVAREKGEALVDEIELRLGDDYDDEHRIRLTARLPLNRPAEVRASKEVRRADTEVAVARLEETSLERRAELCFPSVDTLVERERRSIYNAYMGRQEALLAQSEEWRLSGVIDELSAAHFELETRIKLATRQPASALQVDPVVAELPPVASHTLLLVRDPTLLGEMVREHHPSVAVRQAAAERFQALSLREDIQRRPRLRFVEVSYRHDTGGRGSNGVGGRLAVEVPFGMRERANADRYQALMRMEQSEERRLVEEQVSQSLEALSILSEFESQTDRWAELQVLAVSAEHLADRWWMDRLAGPSQVAGLLDEAYAARSAVLDARERAGIAGCTLLAMTGVPPERWPRR